MSTQSRSVGVERAVSSGLGLALLAALASSAATAEVWVIEPSVSVDQRFDDNYRLETELQREVSATRLVGDVGISRRSQAATITGGARVDALITQGEFVGDELNSNQVFFLDAVKGSERTKWRADVSYKLDTPSRDISADLSSEASQATDSGVVTQRSNVARQQLLFEPSVTHALSRRSTIEAVASFTGVVHATPTPQDAIYTRYLSLYNAQNQPGANNPDNVPELEDGSPLSIDQVTGETVGIFTPDGELDDYVEAKLSLNWRYSLSPISTFTATAAYSRFESDLEAVDVLFEDLVREGELDIYRRPRGRLGLSTTSTLRLGYERDLTQTLKAGFQGGIYINTSDEQDTLRPSDRPDLEFDQERFDSLLSEQEGWLANVSIRKDAGLTRYTARFGVDVQPSSVGTQVEAQELTGDVIRTISPLLDASLRVRLYEPDRLGANPDDQFARRFLSVEPKVVWRFSRAWTAAAAYRYRRQKSRVDVESGESNALLFSLTYTPPSAVRDAAAEKGL